MQDRVPLYPGRVKLTPVAGQENVYDMVRADQPTQEGTPLNKNSLLKDATAALFQLSGDTALPDKVFEILSKAALAGDNGILTTPDGNRVPRLTIEKGTYTGTGKYGKANPTSISFSSTPELVFVSGLPEQNTNGPFFAVRGGQGVNVGVGTETETMNKVTWGSTVSWYTTKGEAEQMNDSREYVYIGVIVG